MIKALTKGLIKMKNEPMPQEWQDVLDNLKATVKPLIAFAFVFALILSAKKHHADTLYNGTNEIKGNTEQYTGKQR